MSIITISSIFSDFNEYADFCNDSVVASFIDTTTFETTLTTYIYTPIWLRYKDTPIKFSNDDKGKDAFLRNFYNQLSEVVFDFHNYAKENIDYFLYQNDITKQGKPMSKTITSGIAPINQTINQAVDSTNLASGTGSQFVSETVYNGVAWHKLVEGYFTPNRKTEMLKTFQWLFVSVYSPETRYDDKIEEKRYVELSFVDDDNNIIDEQKVYPTKSYYTMSEVNIQRPLMLDPQNVKKDVEIAGITGAYMGDIYPPTTENVDLTQDVTYLPPTGYTGLESVTIHVPDTALPENIKIGVNIGGVIGTLDATNFLPYRISSDNHPYIYEDNTISDLVQYAFSYDPNITKIKSNSILSVGSNAFYYTPNITEIDLTEATSLSGNNNFNHCSSVTSINLPKVTSSITSYCCSSCTSLTSFNAPLATGGIGNSAFSSCTHLINVSFPSMSGTIQQNAFQDSLRLETVDLGNAQNIASYVFRNCSNLTDVYLHYTSLCTLSSTSSFNNINQMVTIHVPSSLITTYQTATNWSTSYNNAQVTFVAI